MTNEAVVALLTKEIKKQKEEYILQSNKAVTISQNGTIEITPSTDYDGMQKVTATVAVDLPDLETNKAVTINASTYTSPVEVTPSNGKDAMEKVTVTLSPVRLYSYNSLNDVYPYWSPKQELEVGDILAGAEYEQYALQNRLPVLDVKTVAEVKELGEDYAYSLEGYTDTVKCYQAREDGSVSDWFTLNTDNPNYTPSEEEPAYFDF